ncbi:hypothetical protein C1645_824287 [Glomus cerebriforme]|uniref:F-box domain-containing protein n=1 Tax=Glomus cerebriforme TaxID=658196 RepID=A0A397SYS2_9GLOM|nr:hypothetical protein C1645_824287 [Glomus cerebriforme]
MAASIIENSGGHLKKIFLFKFLGYYYEENFNENSLNFIRKIGEHCPSIEYLTLAFSPTKEHYTEVEKLLKVCQKLKSLILLITYNVNKKETFEKILENRAELLKTLIRSAPTSLREIKFFNDFRFSLQALEEFLKSGKVGLHFL